MDVSAYLKAANRSERDTVKLVIFEGKHLDAASIHRWRRKLLG